MLHDASLDIITILLLQRLPNCIGAAFSRHPRHLRCRKMPIPLVVAVVPFVASVLVGLERTAVLVPPSIEMSR